MYYTLFSILATVAVGVAASIYTMYEAQSHNARSPPPRDSPPPNRRPRDSPPPYRGPRDFPPLRRNRPRRNSPTKRSDEDNCSICDTSLRHGKLTEMPCNHQSHEQCFIRWEKLGKDCPVCSSKQVLQAQSWF